VGVAFVLGFAVDDSEFVEVVFAVVGRDAVLVFGVGGEVGLSVGVFGVEVPDVVAGVEDGDMLFEEDLNNLEFLSRANILDMIHATIGA
jgi:hypothetical protein